jgi:hypothetical protein
LGSIFPDFETKLANSATMTEKPVRIQLSRKKGWRMPPNTMSVARPTMFGNPFRIGQLGITDAATAVRRFRRLLRRRQRDLSADHSIFIFSRRRIRAYLRGKNLACWCLLPKPGEPDLCHAAVLLEIANRDAE